MKFSILDLDITDISNFYEKAKQFENFIIDLYKHKIYKVDRVNAIKASDDTPIMDDPCDLIFTIPNSDKTIDKDFIRVAVQCNYKNLPVTQEAIYIFQNSLRKHKVDKAIVVTNHSFSLMAQEFAKLNRIELIGRNDLIRMFSESGLIYETETMLIQ